MTKILTDEDGKQYELVIGDVLDANSPKKYMLIEPLPTPPAKESYNLLFDKLGSGESLYDTDFMLTPDQAEAVAEAIEIGLEYIQSDTPGKVYIRDAFDKARAAVKND